MALIKNILNEGYADATETGGGEQSVSGGKNYEFVNDLLSSSMNNSQDVVDPRSIYSGYNEETYDNSSKAFGGLKSEDYLNLLYPNMNQQLLKGNYQGSIVGSVPIFTAKDNISPLAMMAFRRDQLRAASYAALQDQLKPAKWEIPTTKIPMYSDKIRESFISGIKYWDDIATQISRQTGQDGWKVLESGKTEYGIMYRNFLSSMNGLANKFDYISLYAAKQQDLHDKGFYVGINTDETLGKVFQGAEDVENFVYNNDIGSLIDKLGAQMNFNSVLYDAIKQTESDVVQTFGKDPTFSTSDMQVWVSKYLEAPDPSGRKRLDVIAENLMAQYPSLAKGQDITADKIKTWISGYMGVKDITKGDVTFTPKNTIIQQAAPDNIDAMAAGAFADINDLGKGNVFVGDKGTIRKVGGLLEVNVGGEKLLVNPANTDSVLRYMLLAKGYTGEKIDQMSVNLKSQFQAEFATAFNELTGTPEQNQQKVQEVQTAYSSNVNNVSAMTKAIVASHGFGIPVPNTEGVYITDLNDVEKPDIKGAGVSRQYTFTVGDLTNVKGVAIPIDAQTLGTYANEVRGTSEGTANKIQFGEGSLTYYRKGDYMIIPDAIYVQDGSSTQSKIVKDGVPLQIGNNDIKIPNSTYKNMAYSGASKIVESYKKIDKVETGFTQPTQNSVAVGQREYTAQWFETNKAEAVGAYKFAEFLKTTDAFKGYNWAAMTPEKRMEVAKMILSQPENKAYALQLMSGLDLTQIEAEYNKLFTK